MHLSMQVYTAVITDGTPKRLEHMDIRWILPGELDGSLSVRLTAGYWTGLSLNGGMNHAADGDCMRIFRNGRKGELYSLTLFHLDGDQVRRYGSLVSTSRPRLHASWNRQD